MTALDIAAFYIGLNLLILMVLAFRISLVRRSSKIGMGDGNDETMQRTIRVHGNGTEWVPGVLIGLVVMALMGFPLYAMHTIGGVFTLGRLLHAWGYSANSGVSLGRFVGSSLTYLTYAIMGAGLILHSLI